MPSKRRYKRIHCNARVDYGSPTEVLIDHEIENLSLGGACLSVTTVQPVGTAVLLVLTFPELEDQSVEIEGEVVWANDTAPRDIGIRFDDMAESDREALRGYIRRFTSDETETDAG